MKHYSLIPPKERLVKEYIFHANVYNAMNVRDSFDDFMSQKELAEYGWHSDEVEKLGKVLDTLYPGWHDSLKKR